MAMKDEPLSTMTDMVYGQRQERKYHILSLISTFPS